MSAVVRLGAGEAVYDVSKNRWTGELALLFNTLVDPDGPTGWDPYPEATMAQLAVDSFGGEIVSVTPIAPYNPKYSY